jgi:hypothetical protein
LYQRGGYTDYSRACYTVGNKRDWIDPLPFFQPIHHNSAERQGIFASLNHFFQFFIDSALQTLFNDGIDLLLFLIVLDPCEGVIAFEISRIILLNVDSRRTTKRSQPESNQPSILRLSFSYFKVFVMNDIVMYVNKYANRVQNLVRV